jgi:hypothetical protein
MSESTPQDPPPSPPPPPPRPPTPPPLPRYEEPSPQEQPHKRTPADQVAELRAEAAQYRISYRNAQQERDDALEQARQAREQLESEKTKAVAPLQAKLLKASQRAVDFAIQTEMISLGLQDPDLLYLYTKMPDAPKVVVSDDFEVSGAKELAAAFKKWKPDYFKKAAEEPPPSEGRRRAPPKTSEGNEPAPSEGGGPAIDLRDRVKYPPGSPAYKAAYRTVMNQVPRR